MQEKEANMGFRTGSPNLPLGPLLCHAAEQSLNFLPKVASANVAKDTLKPVSCSLKMLVNSVKI